MKKLIVFLVLFGLFFTACGSLEGENIWNQQRPAVEGLDLTPLILTPGEFTGRADGFHGEVIAAVTINGTGTIVNIDVDAPGETPDFYIPAFEQMVPAMLAAQSANVDTYTGATFSSDALIAAVQEALTHSSGGTVAADTVDEPALEGDVFIGVGSDGYGGEILVALTIDNGVIVDVNVIDHSETPGIANPAFDQLIEAVLAAQSSDVDTITAATYTSRAFISAVQEALAQAD